MKKLICLLLILSSLLSLTACRTDDEDEKKYKTRSLTISNIYFNTVSTIHTYADESDENIEKWANIADETLSYYHKLFDIYYEYSGVNNIKTINRNAGKSAVKVDEEMIDFLEYCKELYTITQGKTNVMLGSVLKLWHDCREEAEKDFGYLNPKYLPTDEELRAAAEHVSIDSLVINKEESTVYISDPKASLDVGAIAKGYTVEILYNRLKAEGADSVALNIGGNLRTIGLKPGEQKWVTGITNPDKTSDETLACRIQIGDTAVVTSGDYERFFIAADKKYHHIIDPATLVPADYFASVSIITPDSGLADALSTALFCMSYEDGLALVESLENVEVIWVDKENNLKRTSGIEIVK